MTIRRFNYFVVLAGMRTGSNLLEEQLAAMPGIEAHGEVFNPHFFGKPNVSSKWDLSIHARNSDPVRTIAAMCNASEGLPGFRLFYDHDARAIDHVLADERAAKIVLTRRPSDSYVSLKIARKTGQWWLGDMTSARKAKVSFDAEEYGEFLNELSTFQNRIARALQITGQTAFHISYDDLSDADVLAGLGVRRGDLVGLNIRRSADLLIGARGLDPNGDRSGGAYVVFSKADYVYADQLENLAKYFMNPKLSNPAYDADDLIDGYVYNIGFGGGDRGYLSGPTGSLWVRFAAMKPLICCRP